MSAGSLIVRLLMDTGSFSTDTKRAEKRSKEMAAQIDKAFKVAAGAAFAAGGAFVAMTAKVIGNADAAAKSARSIGITTESLTSLQYAAELSGVSSDEFNASLIKLNRSAADGSKAFDRMGVSTKDANGNIKGTDVLLKEVSDKFAGYKDGAEKSALAQELFGKSGANMISFLNSGSEGLTEMQKEAEKLGVVIGGELAANSELFNDNLTRIQKSVMGLVVEIAGPLVGALAKMTTEFLKAAQAGDTLAGSIARALGGGAIGDRSNIQGAAKDIEVFSAKLEALDKQIAKYGNQEIPLDLQFARDAASADLAASIKNYTELAKKLNVPAPVAPTGTAPGGVGKSSSGKAELDDRKKYDEEMRALNDAANKYQLDMQDKRLKEQLDKDRAYQEMLTEFEDAESANRQRIYTERLVAQEELDRGYWEKWLQGAQEAMTSFNDLAGAVINQFTTGFGNAFEKMVFDGQSLKKSFSGLAESMARSVVNALAQMAAQWLAYQAVQMLVGKTTQAGASSAQTFGAMAAQQMAAINAFASTAAIPVVGPAMAPAAAGAALAATSPFVATIASLGAAAVGARATGGPVSANAPYLVGERGAEMFVPHTAGSIVPNNKLGGGGNVTVNLIEDKSRAGQSEQRQSSDGSSFIDVFVSDIMGNGPGSRAMQRAYGLQRRGY
jgi:lambda family phage tail tape measure protein